MLLDKVAIPNMEGGKTKQGVSNKRKSKVKISISKEDVSSDVP